MIPTKLKKVIRKAQQEALEAAREEQLQDDLKAIKVSDIREINIHNPTPELLEYIKRSENLLSYYSPKFLTHDLSKDKEYTNLSLLDQYLILTFALAQLNVDVYEVIHRKK